MHALLSVCPSTGDVSSTRLSWESWHDGVAVVTPPSLTDRTAVAWLIRLINLTQCQNPCLGLSLCKFRWRWCFLECVWRHFHTFEVLFLCLLKMVRIYSNFLQSDVSSSFHFPQFLNFNRTVWILCAAWVGLSRCSVFLHQHTLAVLF